jgi:hypothetical protein
VWRAEAIWRALLLESLSNRRKPSAVQDLWSAESADLLAETMSVASLRQMSWEGSQFRLLCRSLDEKLFVWRLTAA